jgi:aminoglycoside/choline kinase family phosphotransferase
MQNLMIQPWVNCHFDFERRNLILNQEQITVIDYQDMKIGPIGIDLSGILIDHYYNVDFKNIENMLNYFSKQSKVKYSNSELLDFLRWGCIQRNMRILGTLANLYLIQRRDFRLKDLSMILTNLLSMIPDDFEARDYILDKIQPKLEKRISKI